MMLAEAVKTGAAPRACSSRPGWSQLCSSVFGADAERLQKFNVLLVQAEIRIALPLTFNERRPANWGLVFAAVEADSRLKHQKNVVPTLLDLADHITDLLAFAERFVDGVAKFLHKLFELWIQNSAP